MGARTIWSAGLAGLLAVGMTLGTGAAAAAKDTVQTLGDFGQFAPVVTATAIAAGRGDGQGLRQLALATGAALVVTHTLKPIINRRRPNGGHNSFPSGHTTLASAGAGFLYLRYGWKYGLPAYAATSFVAYSRVHAKEHYTTDVLVGGTIGLAANVAFTHRYHGARVTPTAGPTGPGIALTVAW